MDVRHISRNKKDSSDDVLRQEMRRVVDTSTEPGRIVLISGGKLQDFIILYSFIQEIVTFPRTCMDFGTEDPMR